MKLSWVHCMGNVLCTLLASLIFLLSCRPQGSGQEVAVQTTMRILQLQIPRQSRAQPRAQAHQTVMTIGRSQQPSMPTIQASAKRSHLPHYQPLLSCLWLIVYCISCAILHLTISSILERPLLFLDIMAVSWLTWHGLRKLSNWYLFPDYQFGPLEILLATSNFKSECLLDSFRGEGTQILIKQCFGADFWLEIPIAILMTISVLSEVQKIGALMNSEQHVMKSG